MKTFSKIAILTALVAFVSSCQKEKLPVPGNSSSQQANAGINQRTGDSSNAGSSVHFIFKDDKHTRNVDGIVEGGDDDRDGGGGKKDNKTIKP